MTHEPLHLKALDGRGITTAQLHEMNRRWHEAHDEAEEAERAADLFERQRFTQLTSARNRARREANR